MIVDREAASDLGMPVGTIADTLRMLVGGLPVSKFRDGDEQYDVWLRAEAGDRSSTKDLYELTFPSPTAGLVEAVEPGEAGRGARARPRSSGYGRERIVTVLGNPESDPAGRGREPCASRSSRR